MKINVSEIIKALSDENRVTVLSTLNGGEMCAADILERLDITQPTLSHHMKTLCETGIVKSRKQGKRTYYSVNSDAGLELLNFIKGVFGIESRDYINETAVRVAESAKRDLPSHLL